MEANRLADLADHEILYVLQRADVEAVAEDMVEDGTLESMPDVDDILVSVQHSLEDGLGSCWTDYMRIAIELAVEG